MKSVYYRLQDKLSAWNLLEVVENLGVDTRNMGFEIRKEIIILTTAYKFERLKEIEMERESLIQ